MHQKIRFLIDLPSLRILSHADYKGNILTIFTFLQNMYKALLKNSFLVRKKVSYKNAENADF